MHYDPKLLLAMSDVTWLLRERAPMARAHQGLDEKVIEIQIEGKSDEIQEMPKDKKIDDLDPGLWRSSNGFVWFKGDPKRFKEIRTISPAKLEDPHIPRITIIAVIEQSEQLKQNNWYQCEAVKSVLDRFKPKWVCKGYIVNKVGDDKVRIDYVPVALNESALHNVIKNLIGALSTVGEQIEEVFDDHGSKQELDLFELGI
ncbi:hypothetical protein D3C86_1442730 [compost metagenome]